MDQGILVTSGRKLIELLNTAGIKARAAIWIQSADVEIWKLWIVPQADITDKREFYRRVAEVISANRDALHSVDISDIEFAKEANPVIAALKQLARVETGGTVQIQNSTFNGVFIPNCIILQMTF